MTPDARRAHPPGEAAPNDGALPAELLRVIEGLARMNARRDYAAHRADQEPRPDAA